MCLILNSCLARRRLKTNAQSYQQKSALKCSIVVLSIRFCSIGSIYLGYLAAHGLKDYSLTCLQGSDIVSNEKHKILANRRGVSMPNEKHNSTAVY